ncbi:TonB-dependent receptor [Asticcacaulis sp. EMRT-3]|uniref:TonB-dependent receptor domain-containing protein n=1 Tax=Asticcacaulis sp. EMRT-3 TaxID=3040349 RepID=UPI0024AF2416|nr:TonB-dependent receptor [Asticcacaulis sp. EMRT-3]MDI7774187.1 TonB-dependent receptor [Asticcacaulis sp. EMRT-3]
MFLSPCQTRLWLLSGTVLGSVVAVPALAQTQVQTQSQTQTQSKAPTASGDDPATEVIVTGSRLHHTEYESDAPVQIISAEKSSLSGMISAAGVLQSASVAATSGQIDNTFTAKVPLGGAGINTISLRGLGAQRTLVLLNGHRMPPAGVGGTVGPVDLSFIPQSLVARYEILKDGASSIYGSDAVAGVVNIITRDKVNGATVSADARVTQKGGGDQYDTSLLFGKTYDKGDFLVSADYYTQTALRYSDRSEFACPQDNYTDASGKRADIIDPNTGTYKCFGPAGFSGYVGTYLPLNSYYYYYGSLYTNIGGSLHGSRAPTKDGSGVSPEGVAGYLFTPYAERNFNSKQGLAATVVSPVKRLSLFASGHYRPDWAGGAELYGELMYGQRTSEQDFTRVLSPYISGDNPTNPFNNVSLALPVPGYPNFYISDETGAPQTKLTIVPFLLAPANSVQTVDYLRALGGVRGDMGRWHWDAYVSASKSHGTYTTDVIPTDRLEAVTGTEQTPAATYIGTCNADAPAGCVPLVLNYDLLVNNDLPKALTDYLFQQDKGKTDYTQLIAEATMTGDLLQLPAGPLGSVFGVNFRHDEINDVPGQYAISGDSWRQSAAGQTKGQDTLSEAFFELNAPLVRDQFAMKNLSVSLSGRFSNYDSVGSAWTYKTGFNWALDNRVRLRGTYGTSFRAPALYELYLNDQTTFYNQNQVDPCINYNLTGPDGSQNQSATVRANCAADGIPGNYNGSYNGVSAGAAVTTGGGKDLKPEHSASATFGFVVTPPLSGFQLAVDFWRISVADQITSSASGIVGACYASTTFRSQPGFCDLFSRDPVTHLISTVDASYRNIPLEQSGGVDFTTSYEHSFPFGELHIDSQVSNIKYHRKQLFPGADNYDYAGTIGDPKWAGNVQTRFSHHAWTLAWTVNYTGASSNIGLYGETGSASIADGTLGSGFGYNANTVYYRAFTKDFFTHDLTVRYAAKDWTVIAGVVNLANTKAPLLGKGVYAGSADRLGNVVDSSQYNDGYLGRTFYLHMDKSF